MENVLLTKEIILSLSILLKRTDNPLIMMRINFNPFPNLESERLYLRQISEQDLQEVFELRSDSEAINSHPAGKTMQYARSHIINVNKGIKENKSINWAITLKGNNKLIGLIGFVRMQPKNYRAEVGYVLSSDYRGKGIMQEALKIVLSYGFNILKLNSVIAVINPVNQSSENLLKKLSFVKEAHLKENIFNNGEFLDTAIYSLLKKNYTDF